MATPFFGKRDAETPQAPNNPIRPAGQGLNTAYSSGQASSGLPGAATLPLSSSSTSSQSKPPATSVAPAVTPMPEGGSKLTVGPNIKLKGVEITDCDTLVVEGMVEATMDSRVIQIAEQGAFKGSAEIDVAEIRGTFSGNLTVRQKLVIYATGKVTGTIRYGKLVVEEGGQLSGEILVGFDAALTPSMATAARMEPQAS